MKTVAVVAKRTSYGTFVLQNAEPRVAELIAAGDATVSRMRRSHEDHEETQREVLGALADLGATVDLYEGARARIAGSYDLVVTVGGDGTVLGVSHQLGSGVALLGVNSAPASSVGFFCAARKGSVRATLEAAFAGKLHGVILSRMRVELNDQLVHNRVLNEALICHSSPAATSRYILRSVDNKRGRVQEEEQKSSGIWIGPAAGSTAAQRSAGGRILELGSKKIQFVVREPYRGDNGKQRLFRGLVDEGAHLEVWSKMKTAKLFLDGHHDEHDLTFGDRLLLKRSDETLTILGLARSGKGKVDVRDKQDKQDKRDKRRARATSVTRKRSAK